MAIRFTRLDPHRKILHLIVCALYLVSLAVWVFAPGIYRSPGDWEPYRVVLTDMGSSEASGLLTRAGVQSVVSEETTQVFVTRFSHVDTVGVTEATTRLDSRDPRLDPFIERVPEYFTTSGGENSLLYILTGGSTRGAARLVRKTLGSGSRLVGWSPGQTVGGLILFAAGGGLLVFSSGRDRITVLVGLAAWIPFVVANRMPGAVFALLMVLAWSQSHGELAGYVTQGETRPPLSSIILRSGVWPGVVVVASLAAIWILSGPRTVLAFVPGLVALACTTTAWILVEPGASAHRDHELFAPVSILTGPGGGTSGILSGRNRLYVLAGLALVFAAAPLGSNLIAMRGAQSLPRPLDHGLSAEISYDSIARLWDSGPDDGLVDASDYIAHKAYQESLAFGRGFSPPQSGEVVTLSRFRETQDGAYERYEEDVLTFDQAWLSTAVGEPPAGLASLLVNVAGSAGVVLRPEQGLYSGYPQVSIHIAYVLLALMPPALTRRRAPRIGRRRSKVVEIVRRRKQVA